MAYHELNALALNISNSEYKSKKNWRSSKIQQLFDTFRYGFDKSFLKNIQTIVWDMNAAYQFHSIWTQWESNSRPFEFYFALVRSNQCRAKRERCVSIGNGQCIKSFGMFCWTHILDSSEHTLAQGADSKLRTISKYLNITMEKILTKRSMNSNF